MISREISMKQAKKAQVEEYPNNLYFLCRNNYPPINHLVALSYFHKKTIQLEVEKSSSEEYTYIPNDPQKFVPRGEHPLKMGGPPPEFINIIQPKKGGPPLEFIKQRGGGVRLQISTTRWGSTSRIHQHTAPQKGVCLQNSSTYSPQKGVRLQNLSTYVQPPKGGLPLEFINIRLQGQFLWI